MPNFYERIRDFRPNMFDVDVVVGLEAQARGEGAVSINDKPFVIQRITHQIIAPIDTTESVQIQQTGLYRINWSLYQQDRYWKGTPPMADTAFGSIRHGVWIPLPVPVPCEGNRTIDVEVTNAKARAEVFTVHVEFHGIEDWREPEVIAKEMRQIREQNSRVQQRT